MRKWLILGGLVAFVGGCEAILGADFGERTVATPDAATGGSGGDGGASATTTSSVTSGTGGASGCVDDAACSDGDPCTLDTCSPDGSCVSEPVAVGEPGTREAPCEGTCQTDGACGLSVYARSWPDAEGLPTKTPLSLAWTGRDAPPPRGILAADHGYGTALLVVFTDEGEGMVHTRVGDTWTKAPTSSVYAGIDGDAVNSAAFYRPEPGDDHVLVVTTKGSSPAQKLAFFYDVTNSGSATPNSSNPFVIQQDADPDTAPQDVVDCDWEFPVQTAYLGTPSWVVFWRSYAGNTYLYDGGDGSWESHGPDVASPLWGNGQGMPAAGTTVAAYRAGGTVYLVAP